MPLGRGVLKSVAEPIAPTVSVEFAVENSCHKFFEKFVCIVSYLKRPVSWLLWPGGRILCWEVLGGMGGG